MASRLSKLLTAKYKNISFKVRKESLDAIGQKSIIHDYPNTSSRYIERQGRKPFEATLDIYFSGDNWQDDFKNFKKALENSSPGRLILPTFGIYNNIIAVQATAAASQTDVGEITIPVSFSETVERPSPTEADATSEDVNSAGNDSFESLSESFENNYSKAVSISNALTANSDFTNLANGIKLTFGIVGATTLFLRNLPKQLIYPSGLSLLLFSQIAPYGLLYGVSQINSMKAFLMFKKLAVFGGSLPNAMGDIRDGKIPTPYIRSITNDVTYHNINTNINIWHEDNFERKQRNKNRLSVVNAFRIAGLIAMFQNAAALNFQTTNDIDKLARQLNDFYKALIEDDTTGIIIPDIKNNIDVMKSLTDSVLKKKRQNAFNVIEINIEKPYPSKLLTYELYGEYIKNESQLNAIADIIKGLNRSMPAHKLEGKVKVLELR